MRYDDLLTEEQLQEIRERDAAKLHNYTDIGKAWTDRTALLAAYDALTAERDRLRADLAQAQKDAERFKKRLFELREMENPPCFVCGYNGSGYYSPDTHNCAANHHAAIRAGKT